MWIFAYHPPRDLPMLCGPLVFHAPVPSGYTLTLVLPRPKHFGRAHHFQPFSMTYGSALMKMMYGIRTFPR